MPPTDRLPRLLATLVLAEREVLTACLTNPQIRTELLGWLRPGDFSRPEHASTWTAFTTLTQAGTPIDYVTLAWECERHHPDHDSPGLRADQLATMAQHPPTTNPTPAVRTVAHASLLQHTELAHHHIETLAHGQADALTVVSSAAEAYRDVQHHAHRLSGTTPAPSRISAALNPTIAPRPMPPPDQPSPPNHHRGR